MSKRRVYDDEGFPHYVTFSCYKRRRYLAPDICKRIVIGTLGAQLTRQNGICIGFAVMLDHVHTIVWFPEVRQISLFMDKWKELTSKQIAGAYQRLFPAYWARVDPDDPIWQARYYDFNVFTERKIREKLVYMHNNPVRAGLVKDICEWPWSSARWYHQEKSVGIPIAWPP